jgi:hypothetical protein
MSRKGSSPLERQPERPLLQGDPSRFGEPGQAPGRRRTRFLAGALTVTVHLAVLAALLWPHSSALPSHAGPPPPPPIQVSLLDQPKPTPPGPPEVTLVKPDASFAAAPALPRFSTRTPVVAATTVADDYSDLLSDSQLAGASTVGEGGGGGGTCDMARVVQQALRRDPVVRAAVQDTHRLGKAIMLWNGDWVRSGGQDGKGLSAVREAVMWEVAFAPEACRNRPVHGLVLLSLADGATRFAVGSGDWRWSDLLGVRQSSR